MTRKKFSELEEAAAEQAEAQAERVFDFTGPTLDDETRGVYYRLRRAAILAGDENQFPDGKIYAEAEVVKILGEDYANPGSEPKCCG